MTPGLPAWTWATWSPEPWAVIGIAYLVAVYATGLARLWRGAGVGRGIGAWQAAAFGVGALALVAALLSPLETASGMLLSAHMTQHMLLAFVCAPLLAYGAPGMAAFWALPPGGRRALGAWWLRSARLRAAVDALMHPLTVWTLFAMSFAVWHLPGLYQAALRWPALHALQHLTMLGSAYLFWWLVLQPLGRRRLGLGAAVLFVLAASVQGSVVASLIAFAPEPLYGVYEASAAALGVSALQDQQLAGMIMRTPGAIVYAFTAVALFVRWMGQLERRDLEFG